jgi:hypothetical protein
MSSGDDEYRNPSMLSYQYNDCSIENRSHHSNQSRLQFGRLDQEDILQILQKYIHKTNHKEK